MPIIALARNACESRARKQNRATSIEFSLSLLLHSRGSRVQGHYADALCRFARFADQVRHGQRREFYTDFDAVDENSNFCSGDPTSMTASADRRYIRKDRD